MVSLEIKIAASGQRYKIVARDLALAGLFNGEKSRGNWARVKKKLLRTVRISMTRDPGQFWGVGFHTNRGEPARRVSYALTH